ncbi:MAG: putative LPS assembly protein LptD, partial [Bacteroidota bacterium]|nr:putative LPS assembly protein LptD [Bacteroidota bacterium]
MNQNKITILIDNDMTMMFKFFFTGLIVVFFSFISGAQIISPDSTIHLDTPAVAEDSIPNDSTNSDSIASGPKYSKDALTYDVTYSSKDSMLFDMQTGKMYLHGEANLKGEDMDLTSDYVEVNTKENYLFARGVEDSTGTVQGIPQIKDGNEQFKAKSIKYNFNTKKGIIYDVITEYSEGYIHGEKTKRHPNNEIHIMDGKYTTCNLDHPHFYIKLTKAKVIPGEKIVAGPMYFVIADIPLKIIGLPFGYIPSTKTNTSGFIIPEYGEEERRGFYLRQGGYFWAVNDYLNTALTFDAYSLGSWGANMRTSFKKRYKYSGNINIMYSHNQSGETILPNYTGTRTFWVKGSYNQDSKANPNSTFSASLNFGSSGHNSFNAVNIEQLTNNTTSSNISYRRKVPGSDFNFTSNISASQNTSTQMVNLNLPTMSLNMNRQYPFKMLSKSGTTHWYDKISVGFSSSLKNSLTSRDSLVFTKQSLYNMENGLKYNVPVSASFTILNHVNFSPSVSYTGRLYSKYINKRAIYMPNAEDSLVQTVAIDTLSGLNHPFDFSFSAPLSTTLYGTFNFKNDVVKAFRHIIKPRVGFSYRPDFGHERWGYYGEYYTETDTVNYSYYQNGIYGSPGSGKSGNITFGLG